MKFFFVCALVLLCIPSSSLCQEHSRNQSAGDVGVRDVINLLVAPGDGDPTEVSFVYILELYQSSTMAIGPSVGVRSHEYADESIALGVALTQKAIMSDRFSLLMSANPYFGIGVEEAESVERKRSSNGFYYYDYKEFRRKTLGIDLSFMPSFTAKGGGLSIQFGPTLGTQLYFGGPKANFDLQLGFSSGSTLYF
jgi:hypothetical protein